MGVTKRFRSLNYDATVEMGKNFTLPLPEKSFIEILLPERQKDDGMYIKIILSFKGIKIFSMACVPHKVL